MARETKADYDKSARENWNLARRLDQAGKHQDADAARARALDFSSSSGIGFFGLLAIVFITLKLTSYIDWSWWWVLSPLWGGFALVLVIILGAIGGMAWMEVRDERKRRERLTRQR